MAIPIISRDQAIRLRQAWYFTGKACKRGHVDKRRVDNWACMQCERGKARCIRQQFPEIVKARRQSWLDRNADYVQEYNKLNHERWLARPGNADRHRQKALENYYANHEERLASRKIYYEQNKDAIAAYKRENRERIAAWRRDYRAQHREEIAAYTRAWAEANRDKRSLNERKRKARKVINGGSHTWDDIIALMIEQRGRCVGCGISVEDKFHVDHKQPLSRGGSGDPENLQLLCQPCNNQKHAKTMSEWLATRGRLWQM